MISKDESGHTITTSLIASEVFKKQHKHVLGVIKSLIDSNERVLPNFGLIEYQDLKGRTYPMYEITKDGFSLLAMGFTGKKAMKFKMDFIDAFNHKEALIVKLETAIIEKNVTISDQNVEIHTLRFINFLSEKSKVILNVSYHRV